MVGDIEALLTELSLKGAQYVVGGGVAVVMHGFLRAAFDLQLILNQDLENLERVRSILSLSHTEAVVRTEAGFEDLLRRAMSVRTGDFTISVASIDDLVAMKRNSVRAQDVVDIQALVALQNPPDPDAPYDGSFEGAARRQLFATRNLSPIERLRWLDRWNSEVRSLAGRAS